MRINRFLSQRLNITRKAADQLVAAKAVHIDGKSVTAGYQVDEDDEVSLRYKGKNLTLLGKMPEKIQVYKPPFCFVSKHPSGDSKKKTIYDLIPRIYEDYMPLGKLAYQTEGVLIMKSPFSEAGIQEKALESRQVLEEFLVGFDESNLDVEHIVESLRVEEFSLADTTLYDYLKLAPKTVWYKVVVPRRRASIMRKLMESGYNPRRLIRIKDGDFSLTEKLLQDKVIQL